jgi:uncharacterized membrane protein HdeD (DUF308 family)
METKRYKNWWVLLMNGIIAILFGLLLVLFTQETIKTVVFYLGLVILVGGLLFLWQGIRNMKHEKRSWVILLESAATITIGVIIMFFPGQSLSIFMMLIGIWVIINGIIQLVFLVNKSIQVPFNTLLLINALGTIALGVILLFNTFAVFFWKAIGVIAIILGAILVYYSAVIKSAKQEA